MASRLIAPRYRSEVLADLVDECEAMRRGGHGRISTATWMLAHLVRSAVASRVRREPPQSGSDSASLTQDVRYATRSLARRPRSLIAAAGLLALAIGLATAMFTIVDALILRPVPFTDPDHLATLSVRARVTGETLAAWRSSTVFAGVEAATWKTGLLTTEADDFKINVATITPGIFDLLGGVRPVHGRLFDPEDGQPGREDRALVSEEIWRTRFGASPALIGRTITVDTQPLVVVGILPASFRFPRWNTVVWKPRQIAPAATAMQPYVRFMPGVPRDEALRVATDLVNAIKPLAAGDRVSARSLGAVDPFYARAIPFLSGGVVLLFVVLCANVASLRLTTVAARAREFGTLAALGASRSRLIRQTMLECALIGTVGCLAGLALAWALIAMARAGLPGAALVHSLTPLTIDARALLVTSIAGLVAVFGVGIIPALAATRIDVTSLLQTGRGGTDTARVRRATRVLLIGQFALSCTLVIGAALLARSFVNLIRADRGFDPDHVLVADFSLDSRALPSPDALNAAADAVEDSARTLPGIRSVTWTYGTPPYGGVQSDDAEWLPDTPGAAPIRMQVYRFIVGPDFFDTFRIPILRGGTFDSSNPTSILIAERLAQALWPGADPVGRQVRFAEGRDRATLTVAGVVRDLHFPSLDPRADAPQIYMQYRSGGARRMLSLGCDGPCPNPSLVWRRVAGAHPAVQVVSVGPLDATYAAELVRPRAASVLALVFAVTAVLASAAGLFSLLSHTVARRQREFGIRGALGATPGHVRRLVWREGLTVALAGTALGWLGGAWVAGALSSFLFQMSPLDPLSLLVVALVLTCAVAASSWAPVRSAGKTAPVTLLREE